MQLTSIAAILPYIFITNRIDYSRWLPVYIVDVLNLTSEIQLSFESGQFVIRHKQGKFNGYGATWRRKQ